MGSHPPVFQDSHGCGGGGEHLTHGNVKAHSLQLGHKLVSAGLGFIGAETQLQVRCFQSENNTCVLLSCDAATQLPLNLLQSCKTCLHSYDTHCHKKTAATVTVYLTCTHFFTASTEPGMGVPPPSPLSYKTPHRSKITPFKLPAELVQLLSAMTKGFVQGACAEHGLVAHVVQIDKA